jgi:hypothetical protein
LRRVVVRLQTDRAGAIGRFNADLKSVYAPTIIGSMALESGNR